MWMWVYDCDSLASRHKINLDKLTCHQNQSIGEIIPRFLFILSCQTQFNLLVQMGLRKFIFTK